MTLNQVVRYFGTQKKAGEVCGITQQAVSAWRGKPIPHVYQRYLELVTSGALKVGKRVSK